MTRQELFEIHKEISTKALALLEKKNADYSKDDPFDNFMVCESLKICSAEEGIVVRKADKMSRIVSVMRKGSQVSESEEDTLIDDINYAILLIALRRWRSRQD